MKHTVLRYLAGVDEAAIKEFETAEGEFRIAPAQRILAFWKRAERALRRTFQERQDEIRHQMTRRMPLVTDQTIEDIRIQVEHASLQLLLETQIPNARPLESPRSGSAVVALYNTSGADEDDPVGEPVGAVWFSSLETRSDASVTPSRLLLDAELQTLRMQLHKYGLTSGTVGYHRWKETTPRGSVGAAIYMYNELVGFVKFQSLETECGVWVVPPGLLDDHQIQKLRIRLHMHSAEPGSIGRYIWRDTEPRTGNARIVIRSGTLIVGHGEFRSLKMELDVVPKGLFTQAEIQNIGMRVSMANVNSGRLGGYTWHVAAQT